MIAGIPECGRSKFPFLLSLSGIELSFSARILAPAMYSDMCLFYIVQLGLLRKYAVNYLMSMTDPTLVVGYSPKVQKAHFPTHRGHFSDSVEQHKKRHSLQQMTVALQSDSR